MPTVNLKALTDVPPSLGEVLQSMYAQQVNTAAKMNADGADAFWRGYDQSKLNWVERGTKIPYLPPGPLAKVESHLDSPPYSCSIVLGPELCVDPVPPAPWDVPVTPPPQPPAGELVFYDIGDAPYQYGGYGTDVKPGDIRTKPSEPDKGHKYIHVQRGFPGSINYFRGWRLVE